LLSYRQINLLGLVTCVAAMLFAVGFLQNHLELEPCPLCVITRIIVITMAIIFFLGLVHNPKQAGQRVYGSLNLLTAFVGFGVQLRHIWLQNLPSDQVPACGPGLEFLLQTQPVFSALRTVFEGSGDCAEISWTFMGLTIPMQSALLFGFLLMLVVLQLKKRPRGLFS
jgi:disulfide bond formation protein DsbB